MDSYTQLKVGMDLKLRPYRVLATGPTSGFLEYIVADDGVQVVEWAGKWMSWRAGAESIHVCAFACVNKVPHMRKHIGSNSTAVSMVLAENKGSFLEFFKRHYADPTNMPFGVSDKVCMCGCPGW